MSRGNKYYVGSRGKNWLVIDRSIGKVRGSSTDTRDQARARVMIQRTTRRSMFRRTSLRQVPLCPQPRSRKKEIVLDEREREITHSGLETARKGRAAMKIIKQGDPSKARKMYRGTCGQCDTVVEFDAREIRFVYEARYNPSPIRSRTGKGYCCGVLSPLWRRDLEE